MSEINWNLVSEEWLDREDKICNSDRVARLNWLASKMPSAEYLTFPGGLITKYLFEEARYCFVYGQFLATIVLGFAFIEQSLTAMFYGSGRDDLERAKISIVLGEARKVGWISNDEYDALDRARRLRNPVTHFRSPLLRNELIEYRALEDNEYPYAIIEQDARHILSAVMNMLAKNAF